VLEVTSVTKVYPTAAGPIDILREVCLTLGPGEAASIVGPSGSGKSTLLYILGALEPPTSGTITLEGRNPFALGATELAAFRNRAVGFVFQDHSLLPQCTVLENVLVPTLVGALDGDALTRARTLLERVGLEHRLEHRPAALSGGEKQRVAIARALVNRPRLLLCDEPTGNLDRRSADAVATLLLELTAAHDTMLIVVTHSVELANRLPRRFEIADGTLVALA
jgi:lipoprotein-releasing system ATP-binding protein